ncbi:MAG TPA: alpha/beta fold hydrolase [Streptosporangiaceae bacterium]|jgi:pimeloyl-ACP methyl ester carboxylesterase
MLEEAALPLTRLVELPGRGMTRVWDCPGPPGAGTLVLIHGVAGTAELNWGKVFAPLARHFRVVAADLRGHGDGIRLRSRFRLEDCADDVAALAGVLDIRRFAAVGYSMGGMVAQLLHRRHESLLSGLVLCSTAGNARGGPAEQMAALAVPVVAAALRWNPMMHLMGADFIGMALLGRVDDPATVRWARAQLSRTTLATTVSAMQAVCEFTSDSWISQVDVPTAVVITTRDCVVPPRRQLELARAIPGASVYQVDADHGACINAPQLFARALLKACWSAQPPAAAHRTHQPDAAGVRQAL